MGRFASFCSEGKAFKPEGSTISWAELKRRVQARDAAKAAAKEGD